MKLIQFFIYSVGGILLAAALERFLNEIGSHPALALPEPIFGIPIRDSVLLVGILELVVALICLLGKNKSFQLGWVAWLATNYLVYRIDLITMGCHPQATCIGSLTDPLHLSRGTTGAIMPLITLYLLLGSYAALILHWLQGRRAKVAKYQKMTCPSCGVHIRFNNDDLGQTIACPQCQKTIKLRKADLLKMACYFCKEHIEFPTHSLGRKSAAHTAKWTSP